MCRPALLQECLRSCCIRCAAGELAIIFHSTAIATSCDEAPQPPASTSTQPDVDQRDACWKEGQQHSLGDVGDHAGLEGEYDVPLLLPFLSSTPLAGLQASRECGLHQSRTDKPSSVANMSVKCKCKQAARLAEHCGRFALRTGCICLTCTLGWLGCTADTPKRSERSIVHFVVLATACKARATACRAQYMHNTNSSTCRLEMLGCKSRAGKYDQ